MHNEPGKGTTFKMHLPGHAGRALEENQHAGVEGVSDGRGEWVLVVEDVPVTLKLIERMLISGSFFLKL
jgi:hypothetical protein